MEVAGGGGFRVREGRGRLVGGEGSKGVAAIDPALESSPSLKPAWVPAWAPDPACCVGDKRSARLEVCMTGKGWAGRRERAPDKERLP